MLKQTCGKLMILPIAILSSLILIIGTLLVMDLIRYGNLPVTDDYWIAASLLITFLVSLIIMISL